MLIPFKGVAMPSGAAGVAMPATAEAAATAGTAGQQRQRDAMRLFLLALMCVYGAFGVLFLLVPTRLSATHAGAWFTASGPAAQLWGAAFLAAALIVDASLIWPMLPRLRAAGVLASLFVGGAWMTAGALIAFFYGADPTQPTLWLWAIFVIAFVEVHLGAPAKEVRGALAEMPRVLVTGAQGIGGTAAGAPGGAGSGGGQESA